MLYNTLNYEGHHLLDYICIRVRRSCNSWSRHATRFFGYLTRIVTSILIVDLHLEEYIKQLQLGNAESISISAQEIFNNDLRNLASTDKADSVLQLETGLKQLSKLIDNKSSPIEVMEIGHTQVHPNLQAAFSLQLQMKM